MARAKPSLPGQIPAGVIFGRTVVQLPETCALIGRALTTKEALYEPSPLRLSYQWIKRGDPFASITLIKRMIRNSVEVELRSPVSGLILHKDAHCTDGADFMPRPAILIPDDEPPAENGAFIFQSLYKESWKLRNELFFTNPNFTGNVELNDSALKERLDEQMSRTCTYVDAMPTYRTYFEDARTRHPELRAALRHLLQ